MIYLVAAGAGLVVALFLGPLLVPVLRRLKLGQRIRPDGPAGHLAKAGTPTMGGLIFVVALVAAVAAARGGAGFTPPLVLALGVTTGFAGIGFIDDFLKVAFARPLGMRGRDKLFAQVVLGLLLGWGAVGWAGVDTTVAWRPVGVWDLGPLYVPFAAFMAVSAANAVNLTDGLDGLAAGSCAISFGVLGIISAMSQRSELAVFSLALMGALIGFLRYNIHPARVFMGDTGSMALGAALASVAVLGKIEVLLVVIGGLYVIETLSVMAQVISFQTTGRRVLKMAPLHHHFEIIGWPEEVVVARFWLFSLVCGALGLAMYLAGRA